MCFFAFYVLCSVNEHYRLKVALYLASQNQIIINCYKKTRNGFINFVCACKFLEWTSRFFNLWSDVFITAIARFLGAALKHGIRNPETETESWKRKRKRKRNTESNINDSKLKNFTWHNLSTIQREFVLVFLAVPLNIFLLGVLIRFAPPPIQKRRSWKCK